jgi:hypothetical protein
VNDTDKDTKARNREIAQNEAERQTIGDIRVSGWAIAAAVNHRPRRRRLGADPQQLADKMQRW